MSLIYNGTTVETVTYNGTNVEIIMFNGTEVFSAGFNFNPTISSNTTNYNLRNAAIAAGWDGVKKLKGTVTINSGVYVYSTSTGTPAFSTGSLPAGSDVTVVNNGTILGRGGNGGSSPVRGNGSPGSSGGVGFYATSGIKVTNNGRISGGGGGGGGGGGITNADYGGGGGGGIGNGSAGGGTCYNGCATSGTLTTNGAGGGYGQYGISCGYDMSYWGYRYSGRGGNGGTYGSTGISGNPAYDWCSYDSSIYQYTNGANGGAGGGGGAAVVGNGYITWNATGTRNGAIS